MRLFALMTMLLVLAVSPAGAQGSAEDTSPRFAYALFAGGDFSALEEPFEGVEGVIDVRTGYAGGGVNNPTHKQVKSGVTGHMFVVQVVYNPAIVKYPTLLQIYWRNIDPFNTFGQFCDKGDPYKAAIFVESPPERRVAETSRNMYRDRFGQPVATDIRDAKSAVFFPAAPEYQNVWRNKPLRYKLSRTLCKRDKRLQEIWGEDAGGYRYGNRAPSE